MHFKLSIHFLALKAEVYYQERTTKKYLYQSGLPAMSEMTTCFWANLGQDDDKRQDDYLISISHRGFSILL